MILTFSQVYECALPSFFFPLCYRFSDKTKNDWEDRHNFQKVPGKYDLLIMDYDADEEEKDSVDAPVKEEKPVLESKLDKRIQNLIELICNVQAMEEMLKEMKYDTKKAPLGQCSSYCIFFAIFFLFLPDHLLPIPCFPVSMVTSFLHCLCPTSTPFSFQHPFLPLIPPYPTLFTH